MCRGPLDPKRDHYPSFNVTASGELLLLAIDPVLPEYTPVAMKARIDGTVIVELDVDERGEVAKVRMIKPVPFGLDIATEAAVRTWRFPPDHTMTGRVAFTFKHELPEGWKR